MRRELAAVCCAVALLLAGCQGLGVGADTETPTATNATATPDNVFTIGEGAGTPTDGSANGSGESAVAPPDPETDRLGWENGYWHNESINVTNEDGLNESERDAVVNRAMARVEYVRGLEFDEPVPVTTVSRETYRAQSSNGSYGEAVRTFDNAKFEALFLIGDRKDSIETQETTLGDSVAGYYSPSRDAIVIVTNTETPSIGEGTLGHELVHAVQDQQFDLGSNVTTRDAAQGRNGLIEGDARTVETAYMDRCGAEWDCVRKAGSGGGGGGPPSHWGVYFLVYFPYSDGSTFVSELRDRGGWAAVNDAHDDVPQGAREVMTASDYPDWEPRTVTVPAAPGADWERVRPSTERGGADYATVGPSAIAASMAYTMYDDYNPEGVVQPAEFFNYDGTGVDRSDPLNYELNGTQGWDGGRMDVYTDGSDTGYVWRTVWTDEAAAERFAGSWEQVIRHWGGTQTDDGNWVIAAESPFSGAVAVHVEGDTVTVVSAPTESELSELYDA